MVKRLPASTWAKPNQPKVVDPEEIRIVRTRRKFATDLKAFLTGKAPSISNEAFIAEITGWEVSVALNFLHGEFNPATANLTQLAAWLRMMAPRIEEADRLDLLQKDAIALEDPDETFGGIKLLTELAPAVVDNIDDAAADSAERVTITWTDRWRSYDHVPSRISWARLGAIETAFCVHLAKTSQPIRYHSGDATEAFLTAVASATQRTLTGHELRYRPGVLKRAAVKLLIPALHLDDENLLRTLFAAGHIGSDTPDLTCFSK